MEITVADFSPVVAAVDEALPDLARRVIESHLDLSEPANREFLRHPDGREQHQMHWHQWGILTHTRIFLRHFKQDIPHRLCEWGLWTPVDAILSEVIDGVSRWELLGITVLLHDIGKFAVRTRGSQTFHFWQHERLSGEIIREELQLERFGLTRSQVQYVALTAEDHFVLALLRKRAREQGAFDIAFAQSAAFIKLAREVKAQHPDDFVEIGILFLGDSLSKAQPELGPKRAVDQYAVNIAIARSFLGVALADSGL